MKNRPDESRGCPEEAVLDAHAAGTLGVDDELAITAHVEACPDCRATLQEFRDGATYGELLREWRSRVPPAQRQRVIRNATTLCRERTKHGRDEPTAPEHP